MSDQIAVMNAGALEQVGTPREIYARPRTRFVADFLGAMNWIDGIGVRPEAVSISAARQKSCRHRRDVFGFVLSYCNDAGEGGEAIAAQAPPGSTFETGQTVCVTWNSRRRGSTCSETAQRVPRADGGADGGHDARSARHHRASTASSRAEPMAASNSPGPSKTSRACGIRFMASSSCALSGSPPSPPRCAWSWAFPLAMFIARSGPRKNLYLSLVILPFWTSFLIRTYAWMFILRDTGIMNSALAGPRNHPRSRSRCSITTAR